MSEALQLSKEKLISDLHQGIADSEELLKLTAAEVGPAAAQLRERVRERINKTKTELTHLQQVTVEKAKQQATRPTFLCTKTPGNRSALPRGWAWW